MSRPPAVHGMVAAGHPATAEAGAAVMRDGGNAVDAALAAVCTAFIAEPVLTAAGGGGFMLVAPSHSAPCLFDGFAKMPAGHPKHDAAMTAIAVDFSDTIQTFHIGQASVATPSLMAMLFAAHRQYGKLPIRQALEPAIAAARDGIRLNAMQASFIHLLRPILNHTPEVKALYAGSHGLLEKGEIFRNRDLANTLEMLAIDGIDEMYRGDLARAIVQACEPDGLLGMADLSIAQFRRRRPLAMQALSGTLLTNPPPSSGGLLIAFALQLLDTLDTEHQQAWVVQLAEVLRETSALRQDGFDLAIHDEDIVQRILSSQTLQQALQRICQRASQTHATEASNRHGSTTHISIIDRDGMAVSVTTSNGEGSGIVVPGSGIHLNNMLGEEDINPHGFHALPAGMTLSSMMAPGIFFTAGKPSLILGSGGSNRLRGAILQVLLRHQHLGQSLEEAVCAPRLHNEGMALDVEPGLLCDEYRHTLQQRGWRIRQWREHSVYFGGVHAISISPKGHIEACGDPRRGGAWAAA